VIGFVTKRDKIGFARALEALARRAGLTVHAQAVSQEGERLLRVEWQCRRDMVRVVSGDSRGREALSISIERR